MYCVSMNVEPARANISSAPTVLAPAKRRLRRS
jgi:hypothetical protein